MRKEREKSEISAFTFQQLVEQLNRKAGRIQLNENSKVSSQYFWTIPPHKGRAHRSSGVYGAHGRTHHTRTGHSGVYGAHGRTHHTRTVHSCMYGADRRTHHTHTGHSGVYGAHSRTHHTVYQGRSPPTTA